MKADIQTAQAVFAIIQGLVTLWLILYTRRVAKAEKTEARIQTLEQASATKADLERIAATMKENCSRHQQRTASLEIRVEQGPTREQIDRMMDMIVQTTGSVKTLEGKVDGLARSLNLINEFLINQGAK